MLLADGLVDFIGSGQGKMLITIAALIGFAWLAGPAAIKKLKDTLLSWVKEEISKIDFMQLLRDKLPFMQDTGSQQVAQAVEPLNIDKMVAARAMEIKTACSKADAQLVLDWLLKGFDADRARMEYIKVLESKQPAETK